MHNIKGYCLILLILSNITVYCQHSAIVEDSILLQDLKMALNEIALDTETIGSQYIGEINFCKKILNDDYIIGFQNGYIIEYNSKRKRINKYQALGRLVIKIENNLDNNQLYVLSFKEGYGCSIEVLNLLDISHIAQHYFSSKGLSDFSTYPSGDIVALSDDGKILFWEHGNSSPIKEIITGKSYNRIFAGRNIEYCYVISYKGVTKIDIDRSSEQILFSGTYLDGICYQFRDTSYFAVFDTVNIYIITENGRVLDKQKHGLEGIVQASFNKSGNFLLLNSFFGTTLLYSLDQKNLSKIHKVSKTDAKDKPKSYPNCYGATWIDYPNISLEVACDKYCEAICAKKGSNIFFVGFVSSFNIIQIHKDRLETIGRYELENEKDLYGKIFKLSYDSLYNKIYYSAMRNWSWIAEGIKVPNLESQWTVVNSGSTIDISTTNSYIVGLNIEDGITGIFFSMKYDKPLGRKSEAIMIPLSQMFYTQREEVRKDTIKKVEPVPNSDNIILYTQSGHIKILNLEDNSTRIICNRKNISSIKIIDENYLLVSFSETFLDVVNIGDGEVRNSFVTENDLILESSIFKNTIAILCKDNIVRLYQLIGKDIVFIKRFRIKSLYRINHIDLTNESLLSYTGGDIIYSNFEGRRSSKKELPTIESSKYLYDEVKSYFFGLDDLIYERSSRGDLKIVRWH